MSEVEAAFAAGMAAATQLQDYYQAHDAVPLGTAGPGSHPVALPGITAVDGTVPHPLLPPPEMATEPPDIQEPYSPPAPTEEGVT